MSLTSLMSGIKRTGHCVVPADAQLPNSKTLPDTTVIAIDPAKTLDNPFQPRVIRNQSADDDLAQSVASSGIHQPILVTPPNAEGFYTVVAGHRRRDAALKNKQRCPAIERAFSVDEMEQIATIENIQRESMALVDEINAVARLARKQTNKVTAKLLGKPTGYVSKAVKMSQATGALADLLAARSSLDAHAFYQLMCLNDKAPKVATAIARRWQQDPNQSLSLRKQVAKAKAALVKVGAIAEAPPSNESTGGALSDSESKSESATELESGNSGQPFPLWPATHCTPSEVTLTGDDTSSPLLQFTLDDQSHLTIDLSLITWGSFRDAINR